MKDRIFCVPITVISGVGALFTAAVTPTQLALQFISLSMFSVIVTGPLLLADVIVTILLFVAIRWRRPMLVLPILFVTNALCASVNSYLSKPGVDQFLATYMANNRSPAAWTHVRVINIVLMSIQFVFAVWALSSNDSPLAQAVMGRLNLYYPWFYGEDEDWQIENMQLEIRGIAQGLTTEFAILIPLTVFFFIAHVWTYKIVKERLRLTTGGHAPVVHVIPSAYAYPSPLASPQDVKPPSYSLVVEKPPLYPTGGDVDKAKI